MASKESEMRLHRVRVKGHRGTYRNLVIEEIIYPSESSEIGGINIESLLENLQNNNIEKIPLRDISHRRRKILE